MVADSRDATRSAAPAGTLLCDSLPLDEAARTLIAPLLFQALHKHSVGACPVLGPDLSPTRLIDTQIDLMLHGLEKRAPRNPPRRKAP